MKNVAVIDYGMGNLHSVAKAVESLGPDVRARITCDAATVRQCERIIFPGVGAIRDCMAEIRRLGVDEILNEAIKSKPVLAVCVGMQALMEHSEENGQVECLGLLKGRVRRFANAADPMAVYTDAQGQKLKVPHMGWNCVKQTSAHPLWHNIADASRFYFVHSYYVEQGPEETVSGTTEYGVTFSSVLSKGNIFAVQFHPEKSQHCGLQLLNNFLHWDGVPAHS
jgi:glutamine amidotransferase